MLKYIYTTLQVPTWWVQEHGFVFIKSQAKFVLCVSFSNSYVSVTV